MDGDPQAPRAGVLRTRLQIGAAFAVVSLLIGGVLNFRAVNEARNAQQQTQLAEDVLRRTNELRYLYAQGQADFRAHLLTANPRYLTDYREDFRTLHERLAELQGQSGGDAEQLGTLTELGQEFAAREQQFARVLGTFESSGITGVQSAYTAYDVARVTSRVRELLDKVSLHERTKYGALAAQALLRQTQLTRWVTAFFALAVLIALWLSLQLLSELNARARAERKLRWQHYFSETIIENLPVMLTIKDAATLTLVRVNRAVERVMGRPRDALLHKDDRAFMPETDAEARIARERAFVAGEGREMLEELQVDSPSGRRTLAVRKVVLQGEDGRPAYVLGTAADITDRLDTERRLREFSNSLAAKTTALEAANRELESFSYSVSHDLRAPLRAVDGYAAILEEDYAHAFDEEGRRYLRAVREGAARMGQLIQDLLTFSRLNRQELSPQVTDTRDLVEAAWQGVMTASPATRAQLEIGELPPTHGDPRLLQQVWSNLLENAAKYTSRTAEPRIRVAGHTEGGEAVFTVTDNGAGFDMRYYDKLFQVFQRLHRESEYPGTGVGLAIVQRIVTRHGGRIWAQSSPGTGARFSFALPSP